VAPSTSSDLIDALESSHRHFVAASYGLSDSDALRKPAPGRWSVIDCVEHVCITELLGLKRLQAAETVAAAPPDPIREAAAAAQVADRSVKIEGPSITRPPGRHATLAQALAEFAAKRKSTIDFVKGCSNLAALRCGHPVFGPLSAREYIIVIAGHSSRHAAQIAEIRAQLAS
jgi:hypothetical protein